MAPETKGWMHLAFQRAWTMPIRSDGAVGKLSGAAEGPLKAKPPDPSAVGGDIVILFRDCDKGVLVGERCYNWNQALRRQECKCSSGCDHNGLNIAELGGAAAWLCARTRTSRQSGNIRDTMVVVYGWCVIGLQDVALDSITMVASTGLL